VAHATRRNVKIAVRPSHSAISFEPSTRRVSSQDSISVPPRSVHELSGIALICSAKSILAIDPVALIGLPRRCLNRSSSDCVGIYRQRFCSLTTIFEQFIFGQQNAFAEHGNTSSQMWSSFRSKVTSIRRALRDRELARTLPSRDRPWSDSLFDHLTHKHTNLARVIGSSG
jgi:hypothetical protein